MKRFLLLSILFSMSFVGLSKTVNLDTYLKEYYDNREYNKCYDLTRVIAKGHYSGYSLTPFGIKFNENITYISPEMKYYELHSLYNINPDAFYYNYIIQNEAVLKYFSKDVVYPKFLKWADSLYNLPIIDEAKIVFDNYGKYKKIDDIPQIKDNIRLTFKLNEIYKFLSVNDIKERDKIFFKDNTELIKLIGKYKGVELLKLNSDNFNIFNRTSHGVMSDIQAETNNFFINLFKNKRFINENQIYEYLYYNTHFTDEEKIFVTYYFFHAFLHYSKSSSFSEYSNVEKIILYKTTVCNGYATILKHFLNKNNIECYKVGLNTNDGTHANNIVVHNGHAYYVDLTWNIYFKDFNSLPNKVIITDVYNREFDYTKIKSLEYIIEIDVSKEYIKNFIKKGS